MSPVIIKNGLSTSAHSSWYVTAPTWKSTAGIVWERGSWSPNSSGLVIFVLHLSTDQQTKDNAGIVWGRGWKGWRRTGGGWGCPSWGSVVRKRWNTRTFDNVWIVRANFAQSFFLLHRLSFLMSQAFSWINYLESNNKKPILWYEYLLSPILSDIDVCNVLTASQGRGCRMRWLHLTVVGDGWSPLGLPLYRCRWTVNNGRCNLHRITIVCHFSPPLKAFKSNRSDAVCNPGHNFWGLFRPSDHPGGAGGGAVARGPRLLRPLHHGLHHVPLLPHLHCPLKGGKLCYNFLWVNF